MSRHTYPASLSRRRHARPNYSSRNRNRNRNTRQHTEQHTHKHRHGESYALLPLLCSVVRTCPAIACRWLVCEGWSVVFVLCLCCVCVVFVLCLCCVYV